jgi:hypothetical protein
MNFLTIGIFVIAVGVDQPERSDSARKGQEQSTAPRRLDDEELADELTRKNTPDDVMERIIRRMERSGDRLAQEYDAGPVTQELQRRIVDDLDQVLKLANRQTRRSTSPSPSNRQGQTQKRQPQQSGKEQVQKQQSQKRRTKPKTAQQTKGQKGHKKNDPADNPGKNEETTSQQQGPLIERRETWGNLRPRERDEISQGSEEDMMMKYRRQIMRYYAALSQVK